MLINQLDKNDIELFEKMNREFCSDNEKTFFEKLNIKEMTQQAASNELLMKESPETEYVYIIRHDFDSYEIGSCRPGEEEMVIGCYSLSLFLSLDMCSGLERVLKRHITVWEWLRARDYSGIVYDYEYLSEE